MTHQVDPQIIDTMKRRLAEPRGTGELCYTLVCNTFGPKFSFHAVSLENAENKAHKWCRYHGFSFNSEYTLLQVAPTKALYGCSGDEFMNRF